jgi:hypothetical protein
MKSRLLLSSLAVLGLVSFSRVRGEVIAAGQPCGNADTCVAGYQCAANVCLPQADGVINGFTNQCSVSDCCGTDLSCVQVSVSGEALQAFCLQSAQAQSAPSTSLLNCTGVPGPAPTSSTTGTGGLGQQCDATRCCDADLSCSTGALRCVPSSTNIPFTTCTAAGTGGSSANVPTACTNIVGCDANHICIANGCQLQSTAPSGTISGTGNRCSETDCCVRGLSCYASICAPTTGVSFGKTTCAATNGDNTGQPLAGSTTPTDGIPYTGDDSSSTGPASSAMKASISVFGVIAVLAMSAAMML